MELSLRKILEVKIIIAAYYGLGIGTGICIASRNWILSLFTTTVVSLNAFVISMCNSSYSKSMFGETSPSVLPARTTEGFDEATFSFLTNQLNNNNLWIKLSIIISLALFLRVTISKKFLPIAFSLDYLLMELLRYINGVYFGLFHSDGVMVEFLAWGKLNCSRDWSNSKIVAAALCLDAIKGSIMCCLFYITITVIPVGTYREIRTYYDNMKSSEKKTSTMKFRIVNRIKPIMEKYPSYLIILWCNVVIFYYFLFQTQWSNLLQ